MRTRPTHALLLVGFVACSTTSVVAGNPSSSLDDAGGEPEDAGVDSIDSAAANDDGSAHDANVPITNACATQPVTLWVTNTNGFPSRIYVPASHGGTNGSLLFDMGSETTFVATEAGSPDNGGDGGTLTIGTCTQAYMGRPYHAEDARGLPNLGTFGTDQILAADSARFDLEAGVFDRFLATAPDPVTTTWSVTPVERVEGSLLVRVKLDGVAVRLLIDTGSPDILWLHQDKKPGDVETETEDALGNLLPIYEGNVSAEISPGHIETLPVGRMPSFPYLEQRIKDEFGGDVQGLLGVAALGSHFAFDNAKMVLLRKL